MGWEKNKTFKSHKEIMEIKYYARLRGGIRTHLEYLLNHFKAKLVTSEVIFDFYDGTYGISRGIKLLQKEMESCDIFHIHHATHSLELLIPSLTKKMNKKPAIINTFHTPVGENVLSVFSKNYMRLIARLYKETSKKFIVVGTKQKEVIEDIVGDNLLVIPNGVDTNKFKRKKAKRFFKDFTVGYLGRLHIEKNISSLVRACKKAGANLVIAGTGTQYEKLKKMENEKLKVLGFVKDSVKFYNSIDVFASPSHLEGHPYTVLEAMSCGKPVIVSNFGGEEKILEDCGIICGTKVKEISKAIKEIKNMDLKKMGNNARKLVKRKYDLKDQIEKLNKVYKSVLK